MKNFNKYIINIKNIKNNIQKYKQIDSKSKICAVVKANAYGLGIDNIVSQIESMVDCFAVANFNEALNVRKHTQKDIIILNFVSTDQFQSCIENRFQISVSNFNQLVNINKSLNNLQKIDIHIAVDTGMHRLGFDNLSHFEKSIKYIKNHSSKINIVGIFSHIFNVKNKRDTLKQNRIFIQYLKVLKKYFNISKITRHLLASEGAVNYPNLRYDMVRLGILIYSNFDNGNIFNDSIEIKSKIIEIKKIKKGEAIGYNKKFIAKSNGKIAILPIGYYDGIMRSIFSNGYVLYKNNYCKILGNICMDMLAIDISKIKKINIGDLVTIIGKNNKNKITLTQFANWQHTISYEVLTNIKHERFDVILKNN